MLAAVGIAITFSPYGGYAGFRGHTEVSGYAPFAHCMAFNADGRTYAVADGEQPKAFTLPVDAPVR